MGEASPLSPPSAIPQDPFMTPWASVTQGIIASWYLQSEEYRSKHATEEEVENQEGVPETLKTGRTPTLDLSYSDDAMTEVKWREKEPCMPPTMCGKKRNKGKGVRRPETPEWPILNMLRGT